MIFVNKDLKVTSRECEAVDECVIPPFPPEPTGRGRYLLGRYAVEKEGVELLRLKFFRHESVEEHDAVLVVHEVVRRHHGVRDIQDAIWAQSERINAAVDESIEALEEVAKYIEERRDAGD